MQVGTLVLGFGCAHVSASVRWIFGGLVSCLHNWGCIMGGRRGNLGDLGCGGWDVGGTGVRGRGLYSHTLYKAWKVVDLSSLTFKCLISDFSIVAKPNRVSVVGGFCTHPQWVLVMNEQAVGGFVRLS